MKKIICLLGLIVIMQNVFAKEYPYSQIINLLKARAAKDLNHADKDSQLHHAALYSTERAVLKQVMTMPKVKRVDIVTPLIKPVAIAVPEPVTIVEKSKVEAVKDKDVTIAKPIVIREVVTLTGDALRSDIYSELEKLKKLKKEFALSVEEFERSNQATGLSQGNKVENEPASDPLIEQIKSTKKKLKIDNPKQKEQNEIIDKFIKTQPSIPKPKPGEPASDLATDSGLFSDNIVSETLVEILLKQGKKEKAIEVLKKLIWKCPQKKAYFAAQIDSLKN